MPSSTLSRVLQIGDWRVDTALDEISRGGATVKLEPRTMQLLLCLVQHAGEVLSVEQLLEMVWKDVVVNPDSVYQAVAALRRALGDSTKEPVYIANVVRRGYRLIAPVTNPAASAQTDAPVAVPSSLAAGGGAAALLPPRRRWLPMAIVGVLLAAAVSVPMARRLGLAGRLLGGGPPAAVAAQASVAVMPFADVSEHRDEEYFADGLADEIISRLAAVPGLQVPARTSSFYFKNKQAALADVAAQLHVAHVLEGSVRKSGDMLRITAQLVRADSGYQLWSRTFDRPLSDVFKIQDEIAAAVVQLLRSSIFDHIKPRLAPTDNVEAHTLYLQALSSSTHDGADNQALAAQRLRTAVKLDPQFADAWAALGMTIIWKGNQTRAGPPAQDCQEARAAVDRAMVLNPALEEAYRGKGLILQHCDSDYDGAAAQFKRALDIEPGNDDALRSYAWLELAAGHPQQGYELAQRTVQRDPLNVWNFAALGDTAVESGQNVAAEAAYRKAVELAPDFATLHAYFANVLVSVGKLQEAVQEAEKEPDLRFRHLALPPILDAVGRKAEADQEIAAAKLDLGDDDPGEIAVFYACRRDADRAIEWLTKYVALQQGVFETLPNRMLCFKNIEADPRYQELLRQMRAQHPARTLND